MKYLVNIEFALVLFLCSKTLAQDLERLISLYNCKYDVDCEENSFCFGNDGTNLGKCKCKENYFMTDRNRTYYNCLSISTGFDSPCLQDIQCQINLGTSAICSYPEQLCQCGEGARLGGDNKCHKTVGIGELCESNYNCLLGDGTYGYCSIGRCSCTINHHPSEDAQRCVPSVPLGKSCAITESCFHTFASCQGGICRCLAGYVESNNTVCLKAASKVGDNCTESLQCGAYITDSFCLNGICSCRSAHHGYGAECVPDAKLGDRCNHHKECILSAELEYSIKCTAGVCTCVDGVSDENAYGCVVVPGESSKRSFNPILFLITLTLKTIIVQCSL